MNISQINQAKTTFGKISWGTEEQEKETLRALEAVKRYNLEGYNGVNFNDVIEQLDAISKCKDEVIISAHLEDKDTRYQSAPYIFNLYSQNPANNEYLCSFSHGLKYRSTPVEKYKELQKFTKRTIDLISLLNLDENSVKNLMDKLAGKKS